MKVLELILRIVVKLLEVLTKSPTNPAQSRSAVHEQNETPPSTEEKTSQRHGMHSSLNYSDKVKDALNKIIESHNRIHMQDLETIKTLREEICQLQLEVIKLRAMLKSEGPSEDTEE